MITKYKQKYKNRKYRVQYVALRCACHVAYDTWCDIVICDIMLRRSTRSYLSMRVFIQSDIIAYRISDVACSMLHWCKRLLGTQYTMPHQVRVNTLLWTNGTQTVPQRQRAG